MTIEEIEFQLGEVPQNYNIRNAVVLREQLTQHKQGFVEQDNQIAAKKIWCLEKIQNIQEKYTKAFEELAQG